jgi:hypothetical protein
LYFLKPPSRRRAVTALRPAPLVDAAFAETNPVPAKGVMEQLGQVPPDGDRGVTTSASTDTEAEMP